MEVSKELGLLKFKLFFHGVNIDEHTMKILNSSGYRVPTIVRTGASHGIEAIINNTLCVSIPINTSSPIYIANSLDRLVIDDNHIYSIEILKHPVSVSLEKNGKIFQNAGKNCFDRLGITLYSGCSFKENHKGCKFCGIDKTPCFKDRYIIDSSDIVKMLRLAFETPNNQIKHILLSGGAFPGEDFGVKFFADAARTIKSMYPHLPIYVMMPPPKDNSALQVLIDSGIDEIGLNIEIMNEDYRKRLILGKEEIGLERYFNALEYLSCNLPKFGARSILMGGIEPFQSTLNGVEELCKRGVMPIISHYRAVGSTLPSFFKGANDMYNLWQEAAEVASKYNFVIGPTCIPCQNNVIVLPVGDAYRFY